MTKLYVPELDDLIRLEAPLLLKSIELNMNYGAHNRDAFWRIECPGAAWDWKEADRLKEATLETGTVLRFRRYFVSLHAKTNDVEVSIFAHPREDLIAKRNTMVKLVLPLNVLNRIEYERVIP